MRSALITTPGAVEIVDVPLRDTGAGEVRVRVDLIGICATDVHILHGSYPSARYPVRPGHEATGIVVEVGEGVLSLAVGDRVVLDPGVPCQTCRPCRDGRPNLCANRRSYGVSLPGAGAEFFTAPAVNFFRISNEVPPKTAVLCEPLACVLHALDLVGPFSGRDVLIYGAGTIGLLATQAVVHDGAASTSVIDRIEGRLSRARRGGATRVATSAADADVDGWDLVIDATGAPAAIADGLTRLRPGGTYLQVGVAPPTAPVALSPYQVYAQELTIRGSMTTRHSFPRAIRLLESNVIDASLLTATAYPLEDYEEAITLSGSGDVPKVIVSPLS